MKILEGISRLWKAAFFVAFITVPSGAMATGPCDILKLISGYRLDFQSIATSADRMAGCARQPSESAHFLSWRCDEETDPSTIYLISEEGANPTLVWRTFDNAVQFPLTSCATGDAYSRRPSIDRSFVPESIARRFSVRVPRASARAFVLGAEPFHVSLLVVTSSYSAEGTLQDIERLVFGIEPEYLANTEVEVSGVNLISYPLNQIIESLLSRNSIILSSSNEGDFISEYRMSPPIGLPGVSELRLMGAVAHAMVVEYTIPNISDYERYIELLDVDYGLSARRTDGDCTTRVWSSGDVHILGRYCSNAGSTIRFTNLPALRQIGEYFDYIEEQSDSPSEQDPPIDRDNL
ncbi:MAG: hypothetical protein ABR601_09685 [Parasphingopyxis sp.]|nr:hypothetical protein [Sphingomonadales bacterium]